MIQRHAFLIVMLTCLAALSACKEEKNEVPSEGAHTKALTINGSIVSPLCFISSGEQNNPVYQTTNCDAGPYSVNPDATSPMDKEFISAAYLYTDPETPEQKFPGLVGYKYLGDYRGLMAVQLVENGGGSGVFTSVQLLRPEKDGTLRIIQTLAGGDRCNGGIASASMQGSTLTYDVNLTPFDFLSEAKYNPKNLQAYDDLDACAVCCYGQMRYVDGRADGVILEAAAIDRIENVPEEDQTMQSCFDELFTQKVKAGETTLSLKELKDFAVNFYAVCAKQ